MANRYAVLIGVDQYQHASHGAGAPLRAPANDVADWYSLLRRMDMRDGHVRLLTSPDLTAIQLDSANVSCALATTATVNAALDWLVDSMAAAGDDAQGIVFFAGHGDLRARAGSALYLSDYDNAAPHEPGGDIARAGVLDLETLRQQVDARAPKATLLAIVDACRGNAGDGALTGPITGVDKTWSSGRHILVAATSLGQESYERCLDGRWRGQLSWAARIVIDQWATATEAGSGRYVELTFTELVKRAGALIAAISASDQPQVPAVYASAEGAATPVLSLVGKGVSVREPVEAPGHEWDAGVNHIAITNSGGTVVGAVSLGSPVNGSRPTSWYFSGGIPSSPTALKFAKVTNPPNTSGMTKYSAQSMGFSPGTSSYSGVTLYNAAGTISVTFATGNTIYWERVAPDPPGQVYLPDVTNVSNAVTQMSPIPDGSQIWSVTDVLTLVP